MRRPELLPRRRGFRRRVSVLAATALALCAAGRGQEDRAPEDKPPPSAVEDAFEEIEEVSVVAPPVIEGSRIDEYANQITSVTKEQLEALNAQDLTDALRRIPGVVVSRYNAIGSFGGGDGGSIFVRGHGSGRPGGEISTRIDGIPRFVGIWTHPLLDTINVDTASRIDVYKSPQPVRFGNMSFAAVNLIPRRVTTPGFETRTMASYGSFGILVLRGEHGGKVDAFDYNLILSYRQSDGHRSGAGGRVGGVQGRVGYEINGNWYAALLVDHTNADVEDPGPEGVPMPPRPGEFLTDDELYVLKLSHLYESVEGHVKLYLEVGDIRWKQWDATVPEPFDSLTDYLNYGVHAEETFRPWEGGELTAGYDFDLFGGDFVESRPSGDRVDVSRSFYNTGPYLQVAHTFRALEDKLTITPSAGVRYNYSRYFGGDWGAQAGVVAAWEETELHANYARAYNLPGVYVVVNYDAWGRGDDWKDLDAELLDHFEVGVSQGVTGQLRLSLTGYYDDVSDAIRFVPPPPFPPLFENIGDYDVLGAEATIEWLPRRNIRLFAGSAYSYTEPRDVPNVPEWTVSFGAMYRPIDKVTIHVDGQWIDSLYVLNPRYTSAQKSVDAYFLLNARLSYDISRHVEIFVVGENLTDANYEFRPGYPLPGISGTIGLEIKLGNASS